MQQTGPESSSPKRCPPAGARMAGRPPSLQLSSY